MTKEDYIAIAVVAIWSLFIAMLNRWHKRWAWREANRRAREEMDRRRS